MADTTLTDLDELERLLDYEPNIIKVWEAVPVLIAEIRQLRETAGTK